MMLPLLIGAVVWIVGLFYFSFYLRGYGGKNPNKSGSLMYKSYVSLISPDKATAKDRRYLLLVGVLIPFIFGLIFMSLFPTIN